MNKHQNKGFTLVEVIVVAVIVAVLAGIAIPLYNGYVTDARKGTVDNAASALASFMGVAVNTGATITGAPAAGNTTAGGTITATPASGTASTMQIPVTVIAEIDQTNKTVTVTSAKDASIKTTPAVKY